MAETMQSLEGLATLKPAAPEAPKYEKKVYHHHTGFIGGIKDRTAKSILEGRFPERIVEKAVERMLPRGPLGRVQLGNLRVYPGAEHPHEAQKPEKLDVAAMNRKNVRSA